MFRLLDRYVLGAFLTPFIYCLVAFILLFIIGDLFENLDDFLKIPGWFPVMLKYYALFVPSLLVFITAIAVLLAILYSLGRLQKNNEIAAMRSGGISVYRIALPLLLFCLALSVIVLYLNESVVPFTMRQTALLKEKQLEAGVRLNAVLKNVVFNNPLTNRSYCLETFETRSNAATGVTVYEQRPDGTSLRRITARRAIFRGGSWWLTDGTVSTYPPGRLPEKRAFAKEEFAFEVRPEDFQESLQELESLSYGELRRALERKRGFPLASLRPALILLHQKIAMPLACLIMGLIGVSFGLRLGRGGMLAGVGLSLALGFLYYIIYSLAGAFGKQGYLPPWLAAWAGNLIFGIAGLAMLRRLE
jgi:lipopolysaccharide export system permease protein